jgi:hypothetical protein
MSDRWEYSDEFAMLQKHVATLTTRISVLEQALAALKAAQERQAEYQGVTHLLGPQ